MTLPDREYDPRDPFETVKFQSIEEASHFCTGLLDAIFMMLSGCGASPAFLAEHFRKSGQELLDRGHPDGRVFAHMLMADRFKFNDPATRFGVIPGGKPAPEPGQDA